MTELTATLLPKLIDLLFEPPIVPTITVAY